MDLLILAPSFKVGWMYIHDVFDVIEKPSSNRASAHYKDRPELQDKVILINLVTEERLLRGGRYDDMIVLDYTPRRLENIAATRLRSFSNPPKPTLFDQL